MQTAMKATAIRDPERPKRPLSAYFRFAAALREKGTKDVSEIAVAWKKLPLAEKQPFEQAASSDNAAYRKKFDEYKSSGKLDAFKRDPAKPKRPLSAFFLWAQQERKSPDIAKLSVSEAGKVLGARWKTLPAEKKAPLQQKSKAESEAYNVQMKTYKESGAEAKWLGRTGRLDIVRKAEAKKQAEKQKADDAKAKKKAKDAAEKAKAKAKAVKEKETEKAKLRKAKLQAAAEKAKLAKQKEREAKEKAKEKARVAKEKETAAKEKAKAKAKLAAEKKKAKAAQDKLKAKEALLKKREKAKAAAAKKKAKAKS